MSRNPYTATTLDVVEPLAFLMAEARSASFFFRSGTLGSVGDFCVADASGSSTELAQVRPPEESASLHVAVRVGKP